MFEPPLALASLSGEADADWALAGRNLAGAAFLGGIALDEPSRAAARDLVARDRQEFLPADPVAFIDEQLSRVAAANRAVGPSIRPGINVRTTTAEPLEAVAERCRAYDAICELNAHCRQSELTAVGCGETLLTETDRLRAFVASAADTGAKVSVKVRAEVDGCALVRVAEAIESAGGDAIHIDAMDSPGVVARVADATDLFVIANNGVRDRETVRTYFDAGCDAVSVGRPSRDPTGAIMRRVAAAVASEVGASGENPANERIVSDGGTNRWVGR